MADGYDDLARRLGIPMARIPDWRAAAGAARPPAPAPPSYEGAQLQDFMPAAPAPIGPPPPPPRSYEGATLGAPAPSGVSLAEPPKAASAAPPKFRMATGDNMQAAAPAAVSPKTMAQMNAVADASDAAKKNVKTAIDENDRKKNLEGASFYEGPGGAVSNPYGGSPVLISKGGRTPASWQVQEGQEMSEDANAAVTDADRAGREAAGLDYAAGQAAAEYERGYLQQFAKASDRYASEESARAQKYQNEYDDHVGKLNELRAQIRESKVDPFAGVNSGVAKIGSVIAIALGAFASRHGENHGLEAVKHSIGLNIDRQEKEINRLERGTHAEMNFLGMLKQQYGDINQAKAAAHIAYLESAKAKLASELGSPEVADPRLLAGYERLVSKLDDELVHREAQFNAITKDRIVRHDVNAKPVYAGGPTVSKEAKTDARWLSEAYEKSGIPQALSELEGIDQVIDTFGEGDIPGVGPVMGKVPSVLLSDRAVAGRQAMAASKNKIRNAIAGANVGPKEEENLSAQLDGAYDAASLRRVVQSVRRALHHKRQNIQAGASPEGNALYEGRGGSVKKVPLDKPTTPYIKEAK